MSEKSSTAKFIRGAFQVLISTIVIKILGFIFAIPLQRIIGDAGMAYYSAAYSIYALVLQISAAGIPLALSKLIAERLSVKDHKGAMALYVTGHRLITITGVLAFIVLFLGAPLIAYIQDNKDAAISIMAIAPCLLIVPHISAMRGLLQGHQYVGKSSNSQVWEQLIRVLTILVGAWAVFHWTHSIVWAAAAASFGAVTGAIAAWVSLRLSLIQLKIETKQLPRPQKKLVKVIIETSIPVSLASLVLPFSQFIDSLSVIRLLEMHGIDLQHSVKFYGMLTQALRIQGLPLAFATAIGLSCIPAIAHAYVRKEHHTVEQQVNLALRFTTILTIPAAVIFIVLAKPIAILFTQTASAWAVFAAISLMAIFAALEMTTTYILQASGKFLRPVRNMLIGLGIKLIANVIVIPMIGLFGAAVATVIGYAVSSTLNLLAVRRYTNTRLDTGLIFVRPFFTSLPMWLVMFVIHSLLIPHLAKYLPPAFATIFDIGITGIAGGYTYLLVARIFGVISQMEIQKMPIINRLLPKHLRV
ncbi:polysaccharide biosynthesis protein [Fodinisporobacter ferrooxydans]|uniref:Polysaccharide biosynthesis protein n=1 Tax=Fodinisporobacter ferrooxydans TaxID=2901836 RepID=A0ABY4CJ72_9BACL|nr:polysaccharide biosynthesis protein [Alicyclobacillaceae bacterium MYW30-H2]